MDIVLDDISSSASGYGGSRDAVTMAQEISFCNAEYIIFVIKSFIIKCQMWPFLNLFEF